MTTLLATRSLPLLIQLPFRRRSRTRSNLALWQTRPMSELNMSQTIHVSVPPDDLYEMVSDVTRMGEWSPVCRECWWDEGAGPHVGAWFTGRNETPERTWETRSQVVAAEPGRRFGVGGQQRLGVLGLHLRTRWRGQPCSPSPGSSCPRASPASASALATTPKRRSRSGGRPPRTASPPRWPRSRRPPKRLVATDAGISISGIVGLTGQRLTQRKPMWLIPVSTGCGRRAAGR